MKNDSPVPQINMSKLAGGGGVAGALFAIISMTIFLIGIPALRYFLPAAILVGCVVALIARRMRHETPGTPWILSATNPQASNSSPTLPTGEPKQPRNLQRTVHCPLGAGAW